MFKKPVQIAINNRYSSYVYISLTLLVFLAIIYFVPNLYDKDPVLIIKPATEVVTNDIQTQVYSDIYKKLQQSNLQIKGQEVTQNEKFNFVTFRFNNIEQQLQAKDIVNDHLNQNNLNTSFIAALNLKTTSPKWLASLGALPMYLGLDLRGGVHFLMEIDLDTILSEIYKKYQNSIRLDLIKQELRYSEIITEDISQEILEKQNRKYNFNNKQIKISFTDSNIVMPAREYLQNIYGQELEIKIDNGENSNLETGKQLVIHFKSNNIDNLIKSILEKNISTLKNRINELGVAEPIIQKQGKKHIIVQLPGIQDTARAKNIIGSTASLKFLLVNETANHDSQFAPVGSSIYKFKDGRPLVLKDKLIVTGENIINASSTIDPQTGGSIVSITLDSAGGKKMLEATKKNLKKRMAVVLVETHIKTTNDNGGITKTKYKTEQIVNAAVIQSQFSTRFQIEGLSSNQEAQNLALILRAGSLASPMEIVEERTVGPTFGKENIQKGFFSVLLGLALVLVFMAIKYKIFGLIADLSLLISLVFLVAILSILQATLTLPGIAGIVLTVGMAVDANVLIFERIKEEVRMGNGIQEAIYFGYERAIATIADSNITTLLAGIVLFSFGTGLVKGFAITLSIGILTSMFTSIILTRAIVNWIYGNKKIERLKI